ncbi:MAG TPA: phospholipid carrier-dependent glycosyltransferase [Chloroflexi bacterium]|nr:phospholipid carrier-dependent glycosyltransferase [Chloroflexota bacterium]
MKATARKSIGTFVGLVGCVGLAFALRMVELDLPVLRWDEGWSLAHASLPWSALLQVASEDWHPPLYTVLLKLWLIAGKTVFSIRYLSVLLGVLAVPLTYQVARAWIEDRWVGLLAAFFAAVAPLLVYYGQVTRMYPLAAVMVLLAAYCLLRGAGLPGARGHSLELALASVGAMLTNYHTLWPLLGLYLYGVLTDRRRLGRLLLIGLTAVVLYSPWLIYAWPTVRARMATGPAAGVDPLRGTLAYLGPTLEGLAFPYGSGPIAVAALVLVLALGFAVHPPRREQAPRFLLPLLVIGATVLGIAYVSQASRWFAVRHLVPATPFLGLLVAWALNGLRTRWRPLLLLALIGLAVAYWPTCSQFVYAKTLEVVDPFDPTADYRYLSQHAGPNDLVYFNVLSKAGWYENLRQPGDPAWSYAMRWDPIIEPMPRIAARIREDAKRYQRLWFVLYKGTFGPNADLKAWLDEQFFPAGGEWQEDTLFLAYAVPGDEWAEADRDDLFGGLIRLRAARFTPRIEPGGVFEVELEWEALEPVETEYKVFVHLMDENGALVGQHDGIPGSGGRPTTTWPPGEAVVDRHGVFLPAEIPHRLQVWIGLYDPETGERLLLPDGDDRVQLTTLESP